MVGKKIVLYFIAALVALLVISIIPVSYERTYRDGTDEYKAHHALYGKRVKTVTETAMSPIADIGVILVNLRRTPELAPVHVSVSVSDKGVVAEKTISLPPTIDDEFTWMGFDSRIVHTGEQFTVAVSAPEATQESPVGVRFQAENKELAISVRERIPYREYLVRWSQEHQERFSQTLFLIVSSVVLTVIALCLEWLYSKNPKLGLPVALVLLAAFVLYYKIPVSNSLDSAFGGDAFNYILKGNAWIQGEDGFAADPRKAPLYSFLTAIGLLPGLDPILFARWISMASGLAMVVLVSLFLVRMQAPLSLALGASLLLAANRDFQFETVQGLSNSLYAALILASAYMFIANKRYLVSVFAALATLTRYEGMAAACILIPSMWFTSRTKLRNIVREAFPFLLLVSIPLVMFPFTGSVGVRTFSDITGDEGLYVAHSWEYFLPSVKAFKIFFGRLWILSSSVGDVFAAFGWGVFVGVMGAWLFRVFTYPRVLRVLLPALVGAGLFYGTLWGDGSEKKLFIALFAFLTGFGAAAGSVLRPKLLLPVVCMVLVQTAVITAILPKNRYYLQIIPFIVLAMVGALWLMAGAKRASRVSVTLSVLATFMMASMAFTNAGEALSGQMSDYNEKSADQTVMVQAGRYLKKVSGNVALHDQNDLQLRVYVPQKRLVVFSDRLRSPSEQYERLKNMNVEYFIETTEHEYFKALVEEMPEKFEHIATYKTRWADVSATLYRVY